MRMHLGSKKFSVISTVVLASVLANPAYAIDSASPSPKPVAGWVSIKPTPGNPMVSWIIGTKTKVFDCVAAATDGRLAIKVGNDWKQIAKANAEIDRNLCTDPAASYALKYTFTLDSIPRNTPKLPGTRGVLLVFRQNAGPASRMSSAVVYPNASAASNDRRDGKAIAADEGDGEDDDVRPVGQVGPAPRQPDPAPPVIGSSSGSTSSPRITGCSFKNIALTGRVKVVSVGGQIRVRVTNGMADFGVRSVDRPTGKCGDWTFVSAQPDFTVEIVDSGEDFTIALGGRPGVR